MLGSTIFQRFTQHHKSTKPLSAHKRKSTICFDASYCLPPLATPSHLLTTKTSRSPICDVAFLELFRSETQHLSKNCFKEPFSSSFVSRRSEEVAPPHTRVLLAKRSRCAIPRRYAPKHCHVQTRRCHECNDLSRLLVSLSEGNACRRVHAAALGERDNAQRRIMV